MPKPSDAIRRSLAIAAVALVAAVTAVVAAPAPAATSCDPAPSWGTNRADLAAEVTDLVNDYRAGKGLPRLAVSAPLTAAAEWKSLHMTGNAYFAHDDPAPVSRSAYQRAKDCGYGGGWWGENIAVGYATAQSVVNGWLGSAGHRENIENPNFRTSGVGVGVDADGTIYWTQDFGDDVGVGAPPSTPARATAAAPSRPALELAAGPTRVLVSKDGSQLVASVAVTRVSTGQPLRGGTVTCSAVAAGTKLPLLAHGFGPEGPRCAWSILGASKGTRITGVVAVRAGDTLVTRSFLRTLR